MYPLIPLGHHLYLPSYFFVIAIGYIIGMFYVVKRCEKLELNRNAALDICLLIMVAGLVGSRLFHVVWEHPEFYWRRPWDVFKLWQGGFVFYGGVMAAVLAIWIYVKIKKLEVAKYLDLFAPVVPVVYGIGRFATFLSGSGYGKPTTLPWALVYPPGTEAPAGVPVHPTQLYATAWQLVFLLLLLYFEKHREDIPCLKKTGSIFYVLMIGHGLGRAVLEQLRGDYRGALILGLTVSTWLSFLVAGVGAALLWRTARVAQSG